MKDKPEDKSLIEIAENDKISLESKIALKFLSACKSTAEKVYFLVQTRKIFQDYANWLDIDLTFQNFDQEMADLATAYAYPDGEIILAFLDGNLAASVALRPSAEGICEMKRLFVREDYRAYGLGRRLVEEIMSLGRDLGYERMRLDTLETMEAAISLYQSLGFYQIEAYIYNPLPNVRYMEAKL